ncbi:MAG: DUF4157 domain-containing protein [Propionicimonas sp.]|uniref:eCIS core domain-containing protein n=1 Tax=Propionicimonas sp. TaxID=1955623 RepID=UPI003D0E15A9
MRITKARPRDEGRDDAVPGHVRRVIAEPGESLEPGTRSAMEHQLGAGLQNVRVHDGTEAAASAHAMDALAYTSGEHVVLGAFPAPGPEHDRLLAHELAHVVQQQRATSAPTSVVDEPHAEIEAQGVSDGAATALTPARSAISRAPTRIGTAFTHPKGATSRLSKVHATFDGATFTLLDGTTPILSHAAQSGRPVSVRSADATACKGSTSDSYLNNPLYVGIQDFGPIPEGDYRFTLSAFATFSAAEQLTMISGGTFTDPFGTSLHGGDWGSGRAPLTPVKVVPAPPGCGNTAKRSGFYLHGGSLPGSSGCIDIDNDGIDSLLKLLVGYRKDIPVKVTYTSAAPSVGWGTRRLGGFTYPTDDKGRPIKDPSIWDRLKSATGD